MGGHHDHGGGQCYWKGAKEAKLTPRGNSCGPERTKPSPRRNKRGFWLGRRNKLLGEASKKQNTVHTGGTMVCVDQNYTTTRAERAGGRGSGQELDTDLKLEPSTTQP